ncbi:MAG: Holliday junction branch migration DNA helicase RuvB, partial [Actinomycetota bacterium]
MSVEDERVLAAHEVDAELDAALRPRWLSEFVGQDRVKEQLALLIQGAREREEPLDHLLFSGPPGLGKTTLAGIVANEMAVSMRQTSGPALERTADLAAILTNLEEGDVLFVDEIHRMPRAVEEVLYPALEDFKLDVVIGKGPSARTIRLDLPRFSLVGATTRLGLITLPLRERFGFTPRLDYYDEGELAMVVRRSAGILEVEVEDDGAEEIARRARGTP